MKLGIYIDDESKRLVDLRTGEILAEDSYMIQQMLQKYENQYTLEIM